MTDRTLLGRRDNGTYGLDISLPGVDVKTAAAHYMAFSTDWVGGLVTHQTGVVLDAFGKTVTFTDLGYIPLVWIQAIDNATGKVILNNVVNLSSQVYHTAPGVGVTRTQIIFSNSYNYYLPNFNARYAVFNIRGLE